MRKIICLLCMFVLLSISTTQAATFSIPESSKEIKNNLIMDNLVFMWNLKDKKIDIIANNYKVLTFYTHSPFSYVRRIICKNPEKIFYEIREPSGAHGELANYWLIGQHNEKWVVYVTLESLHSMGACFIARSTEANGDSLLISTYNHLFPGQKVSKHADIELFWDDHAQWFGMRRVN